MGKPTKEPSPWQKQARKKVKAWSSFCVRVVIYLLLATLANLRSLWSWTSEPRGFLCDHPSRGAKPNQTRIKVLVYGPAKTGTTSTTELLQLMYGRSYHSLEFFMHIWSPLADRFWSKAENGGSMWSWGRLATPGPPAYKGHSFWPRAAHGSDMTVAWAIGMSEIAEAFEKCGVETLSFDGFENMFWPMYDASPEAKVVMLNWRDYDSFSRSGSNFAGILIVALLALNVLNVGLHYLPWNALAIPLLDSYGGQVTDLLRTGNRTLDYNSLSVMLFRQSISERRVLQHWFSGFGYAFPNETLYQQFWDYGKKNIPKERLVELNLKKHTPADACRMLGVKDKPVCEDTGPIPNVFPLMRMERQQWHLMLAATPWFLFVHWVNHSVTWGAIYWFCDKMSAIILACAALLGYSPDGWKGPKGGKKAKKA